MSGNIFTSKFVNVFWCRVTSGGTRVRADLNTFMSAFIAAYHTHLLVVCPPEATIGELDAVWQTGAGTVLAGSATASFAGTAAAAVADVEACQLINWAIGARYRGGKPRTYLPGVPAAHIVNGKQLDGTWRAAVAGNASDFLTAVEAITAGAITTTQLGTVSFFTAGGSEDVPPTYRTPPVFEPYLSAGARLIIASQRRRLTS
jgi:hypothetical protein